MKKFGLALILLGLVTQLKADSRTEKLEDRINLLEEALLSLKIELDEIKSQKVKVLPPIKGFVVKKEGTKQKIKIGGRIMYDYSFLSSDKNLETALGLNTRDMSEFRRARIHIKGATNDKISWSLNYDFSGGNATVKDTYLKYSSNNKRGFRIGHTVEPFGLEYMNSSKYITFMERSVVGAFYPEYNSGMFYMDENPKHKFAWAVSLFGDAGADGKTGVSGSSIWNSTNRFIYDPVYKNNGKDYLHLGAAYSRRNTNGGSIKFSTRPESHLWNAKFADTGNIVSDSTDLYGFEFLWNKDRLSIQSEYVMANVDAVTGIDPEFSGWYAFASYFLTNDYRPYNRSYRLIGRVKPSSDYTKGGRGAWQVAARYSSLDLNDATAGILGGEITSKTLGLNWYLTSNTRLMWDYVMSDLKDFGDSKSLNMRFQIDF